MSLVIVHVHIHTTPEGVEAVRAASLENSRESLKEPGVVRFDVVQSTEDPTRFVLVEAYRNAEAITAHRATPHYARWRELCEPFMAEPRTRETYVNVAPDDQNW